MSSQNRTPAAASERPPNALVVRAMRSLVYAADSIAPPAFVLVAVTLLGAAFLACVVPARRAASVEPMVALRQE